jgi:hypothetical protein
MGSTIAAMDGVIVVLLFWIALATTAIYWKISSAK